MAPDPDLLDHFKIAFAAAAGGLVRLLFRPGKSWGQTLWVMAACITCGYYSTPIAMHWLALPAHFVGAVGAAAGFIGLSVAEGVLRAVDGVDVQALAARFFRRWVP